jgi:hypothetical protein
MLAQRRGWSIFREDDMSENRSINCRLAESYNNLSATGKALSALLKIPKVCGDIRLFAKISEAHRNVADARQIMLGLVGADKEK